MPLETPDPAPPPLSTVTAIILAAGKGTRMRAHLSKVLHPIIDRPLLHFIFDSLRQSGITDIVVVTGYQAGEVEQSARGYAEREKIPIRCRQQEPQLGTGHALKVALTGCPDARTTLLVLNGDTPRCPPALLLSLLKHCPPGGMALTSGHLPLTTRFGRILREEGTGNFLGIREAPECAERELNISEMNLGFYAMDRDNALRGLQHLRPTNRQGEYYLTDLPQFFKSRGLGVSAVIYPRADQVLGINSQAELAEARRLIQREIVDTHLENGVFIEDPTQVTIGPQVKIGRDVRIYNGCRLTGNTEIGDNCHVGPFASLHNSRLAPSLYVGHHHANGESVTSNRGSPLPFILSLLFLLLLNARAEANYFQEILNTNKSFHRAGDRVNGRDARRVERVLERVENALRFNNLSSAREDLKVALGITKFFPRTYFLSAQLALKENRPEIALEMMKNSYALDPNQGLYQENIREILLVLATTLKSQGNEEQALSHLKNLQSTLPFTRPNPKEVRKILLNTLLSLGRKRGEEQPAEAILHFKEALQLEAENMEAIEGVCAILKKTGKKRLFLEFISIPQGRFPQNSRINDLFKEAVLDNEGQIGEPIAGIPTIASGGAVIAPGQNPSVLLQKGREAFNLKQYVDALKFVDSALQSNGEEVDALTLKVRILIENGEIAPARDILEQLRAKNPENPENLLLLNELEYNAGNYQSALSALESLLQKDPVNPKFRFQKAHLANKLNQFKTAEELLLDLKRESPQNPEVNDELGEVYAKTERLASATALWEEVIAREPQFAGAHFHMGQLLSLRGQFSRALDYYLRANDLKPYDPRLIYFLGEGFAALKRENEARALYEKNLPFLNPGNIYSQQIKNRLQTMPKSLSTEAVRSIEGIPDPYQRFNAYMAQQDLVSAERTLSALLRAKPGETQAMVNLATLELQRGNYKRAIVLYLKSIKQNPKNVEGFIFENLAFCYAQFLMYKEAIKYYEMALSQNRQNFDLFFRLAKAHDLAAKPESAIDVLETALMDQKIGTAQKQAATDYIKILREKMGSVPPTPESSSALQGSSHFEIAEAMAGEPGLLNEAQAHIEEAIRLNPGRIENLRLQGEIFYRQGHHQSSAATPEDREKVFLAIKNILALKPNDPAAYYLKGRVHFDSTQYLDAKNQLTFALGFCPEGDPLGAKIIDVLLAIRPELKSADDLANFDGSVARLKKELKGRGQTSLLNSLEGALVEGNIRISHDADSFNAPPTASATFSHPDLPDDE